ncbi:unnamed protein product [Victoria cruziana]
MSLVVLDIEEQYIMSLVDWGKIDVQKAVSSKGENDGMDGYRLENLGAKREESPSPKGEREEEKEEKIEEEKIKRKREGEKSRRQRSGEVLDSSLSQNYNRMFYTLDFHEQDRCGEDMTYHMRPKFKKESRSQSFTSGTRISYMEHVIDVNPAYGHKKMEENASTPLSNVGNFEISGELPKLNVENMFFSPHRLSNSEPLPVTWDEKIEVQNPANYSVFNALEDECKATVDRQAGISKFSLEEGLLVNGIIDQYELLVRDEKKPESCGSESQNTDVVSEGDNYVDALNTIESEIETDSEGKMKQEVQFQKSFHVLEMKSKINKQEVLPCSSKNSDVKEPPCNSDHTDVEEPPHGISGHSDVKMPPCSSGHSDVEIPAIPQNSSDKELLEDRYKGGLPENNAPGIPDFKMFEDEDNTAPDVEMTKETISDSIVVEHAASCILPGKQIESSDSAVTDSFISRESDLVKLPQADFNFWTNGGLLGLQPSKPPDFSSTTNAPEAHYAAHQYESRSVTRSDLSNENDRQTSNRIRHILEKPQKPNTEREPNRLTQKAEPGTELSRLSEYMNHAAITEQHFDELVQQPIYMTDSSPGKFENHQLQHDGFFEKTSQGVAAAESSVKLQEYGNVKGMKLGKENILFSRNDLPLLSCKEVQSVVSMSSDGCHVNGFHMEPLVDQLDLSDRSRGNTGSKLSNRCKKPEMPKKQQDEKIGQSSYMKINPKHTFIEEPNHDRGSPRHSDSPSSHWSNCSSPPLEHMKISFHPMNDLEGSLLKLHNEPNVPLREIDQKGTMREFRFLSLMCNNSHSTPLVEVSITSKQVDSEIDSDDDTFCKPSLNFSEDMFSEDSESNSEQWEHNAINGRKDDLYDGLERISSAASISSFAGVEEKNSKPAEPDCHYEICHNSPRSRKKSAAPIDDATSRFHISQGHLQMKEDSEQKKPFLMHVPPLQQSQSKQTKSPDYSVKGQGPCQLVSVSQRLGAPVLEAIDPCQLKPAISVEFDASHDKGKLKQSTSLNRSTSTPQPDERDSFLEQIRAKSFNLRRTKATKPNFSSPRPTTNINVAAILEKANAIRQACVGSDDGADDDSNWSDG